MVPRRPRPDLLGRQICNSCDRAQREAHVPCPQSGVMKYYNLRVLAFFKDRVGVGDC